MPNSAPLKILFLCTGNSARSVFGEFFARQLGPERFESYSAGANPTGQVHPLTIKILQDRFKIDASTARSKSWEEYKDIHFDMVITVCDDAKETCPVWPGQPIVAHWRSPDPAAFEGTEENKERFFFQVAMQIHRRIEFLCCLPFEKLNRLRLEEMTQDIGRKETELPDED